MSSSSAPPLLSYAPITPLSTASTSNIPIGALAALEWCVFDNLTQREAMLRHNAAGYGNYSSHHAISWLLRRYGAEWYREVNAVRPWKLYTLDERRELELKGLGKEDFAFVHHRDLAGGKGEKGDGEAVERRHRSLKRNAARTPDSSALSLIVSLPVSVPPGHRANALPAPPFPAHLKSALLAKHAEWLEASKTGEVALADAAEEELAVLEKETMVLNKSGFMEWKFGRDGYGDYSCRSGR